MSINNMLFSIQNMSPALLNVGVNKTQNYNNLTELSSLWGDSASSSSTTTGLTNSGTDTVSLTYQKIGGQMVNDMAAATAQVINQYPELDQDYVIAVIDTGGSREARVYRRSEILANFEGTDQEKEALKAQLDENPLMVFNNANGLPDSAADPGSQALAKELNSFLSTNAKTLDVLSKAGHDPLADFLGDSLMKKILAYYAQALAEEKETATEEAAAEESETVIVDEEEEA